MKITMKGPGIKLVGTCTPELAATLIKLVEGKMDWEVKIKKRRAKK